jgi:hypothetical protein
MGDAFYGIPWAIGVGRATIDRAFPPIMSGGHVLLFIGALIADDDLISKGFPNLCVLNVLHQIPLQ